MKFEIKQGFLLLTVMLLICNPSFANSKRQMTPQQRQIYKHSVAANKQRNWQANKTQRDLYRNEKYRNGFGNYDLYYPQRKTRASRRASYAWFDRVYGAGALANALANDQLVSDSLSKTFLNFLELHTSQLDITKELPSFIPIAETGTQKPLVSIDYFQEEIMPLGGMWGLREVWYKPEDPAATEVVTLEDGKKYLTFKNVGDIKLRAFTLSNGKIYTWKSLVHVRTEDVSDLVKESPTKLATSTSVNGSVGNLKTATGNAKFYAERSGVYWQMKQFDRALADMLQAIKLAPDEEQYYANVAAIYIDQEMYDNAFPYINKAIEMNPNNGSYYIFRGYIHMKRHRNDLFQEDFKRARKLGEKV